MQRLLLVPDDFEWPPRCFGPGAESQAHAPNEVTYKDDLVTAAAMYVAALNLYDPSQADGDATVFRAGLTNNKID